MTKLSNSDEWEIPKKDFKELCKTHNFKPTRDVSATKKNKKCTKYFDKKKNALNQKWDKKNWSNPPMKFLKQFVMKACWEFLLVGNETMMIIPSNSLTNQYAQRHIESIAKYYPIFDRIEFLHYGRNHDRARNSYFVILWRN